MTPTSAAIPLASNVAYEPFGGLQSLAYSNGLTLSRTYTQDYLLATQRVVDLVTGQYRLALDYDYSGGLNLASVIDDLDSSRSQFYYYFPTGRLDTAFGPWGELSYLYDGVGNRTRELQIVSGVLTNMIFGYPATSNRLSTVTLGGGGTVRSFTHDGAGRVTADDRAGTVYAYRYNQRGRLDQLTVGGTVTANYTYDALERMALRTTQNMTPAGTTHYIYDQQGRLLAEAAPTGVTLREYFWLDDMPIAVLDDADTPSPQLRWVHADHLDRPIRITDGNKAVVWDAIYKPFGEAYSITSSASITNNMRFPGQYFLIESGLAYNWHRQYDPTLGRYVQPDPMEFVDGPAIYAYANRNPQQLVDPDGLAVQVCAVNPALCAAAVVKTVELCLAVGAAAIAVMAGPAKKCPPCRLTDGTIVPVGTIGYRRDNPARAQHGIEGEHLNLYKANQNPINCQCFWQSIGAVPPPPQPQWIPIRPFQN